MSNEQVRIKDSLVDDVRLQVVSAGYDRRTEWFQPRIGIVPPGTAVLTMTRAQLWESDIFTAVQQMISRDLGKTWKPAMPLATVDRRRLDGDLEVCPCDMTPAWHAASGKLLMTGHTAFYVAGPKGSLVMDARVRRGTAYSVFDEKAESWSAWRTLEIPDTMGDRLYSMGAGCTQRVDLPGGDILLPVYGAARRNMKRDAMQRCYNATVLRCGFDGKTLRYLEHGDTLTVPDPRGLCEPSLTSWEGRFFLTLRNDLGGYVAVSRDGLHFDEPIRWTFDDGGDLGSYNTQQHWITHSAGLYLVYTRRGAANDMVKRHRAPLFMAAVDPDRLCVVRETERVLIPNHGAQLGNFGVVSASAGETWVMTAEGMRANAAQRDDLTQSENMGADNRVYLCRIRWRIPNREALSMRPG